jgi:chromosome segregation ATPase
MSQPENQLIQAFREEMRTGFGAFTSEIRNGLAQVSSRLDRTNELLGEAQVEIREMKGEVHEMKGEVHEMKDEVHEMKDEVHEMKDGVHEMKDEIQTLKKDMSSKLTGISKLLLQSESSHDNTDKRISEIERRVKKLEDKNKPT